MTSSEKECIDGSAYTLRQIQKYLLSTFFLLVEQKIAIDGKAEKPSYGLFTINVLKQVAIWYEVCTTKIGINIATYYVIFIRHYADFKQ
jgi:hypothetical protein